MCANVSQESVYMFRVYLLCKTYLLEMLQSFYDVIEGQKY